MIIQKITSIYGVTGIIKKGGIMVGKDRKRITITVDKDLDAALDEFLENCGATFQIQSKSHLFALALVDFLLKLEENFNKAIKKH